MAKHPARCPRCGNALEFDTAADEKIVCSGCQALLSMPGKFRPSDKADPLLGQTLGQFELVELLGRGGMGAVYKAKQASLDRFVAIKVLPRSVSRNASFIERFQREARAAAAVIHPHIIQVHDVGQDKGFQFIVMEFVEGESIADLLKREGALPPARAVELLKQVASALAEAHARGIVHRDIKPANILLTAKGLAKVADFGLAKREGVDISVTATGDSLGTPLYMPPEVCRGEKADARSDLYSLGATFYQALAGRPPFHADTPAAVITKHIEAEVPPLAQAAPGTPADLCRIIHRLLRKKPADRFQSAEELLSALDRVAIHPAGSESRAGIPPAGFRARGRVDGSADAPYPPAGAEARGREEARGEPTRTMPGVANASLVERRESKARQRRKLFLLGGIPAAAAIALMLVLVSSSPRAQSTAPPPSSSGTPTPATQHPTPPPPTPRTDNRQPKTVSPASPAPREGPPSSAWDRAFSDADTTAKAFAADQRFGEAAAVYENLSKALDSPRLRDRAQKALEAIQTQADAAYDGIERKARGLLADRKYAEARAALQPAIERFGLPLMAATAKKRLAEIEEEEKRSGTAKVAKDAKKEEDEEKQRVEAEAAKRDELDRALAAYGQESEKVWGHFKKREYDEAEKLIAALARVGAGLVPAPIGAPTRGAPTADQDAAALIREFWAGAEAGVAASKGKFLLVAGASGTIEDAKDGLITLRKGEGKTEERKLTLLAAKQAVHYFRQSPVGGAAALPEKAKANLMAGVFLLAEGVSLDEARQALDAAGDSPSAALYKERWEAVKMGAAEAAAKTAWLRVQDAAKPGITPATAKRLTDLLGDFEKKHGETKIHKGAAKAVEDLKTRIEDSLGYTKWPFDEAEAKRRQKATADALGVKIEQDIEIAKGVKMAFVLIPAGEFLMGSPGTTSPEKLAAAYGGDPKEYEGEFPQHRVKISRLFWMGKYEVTQEQWFALFQTNPSANKDKPKNPVEQVDWNQASGFGKALSEKLRKTFRLPTEAEWEYACRAGTATEFYFGNDAAKLADFGWVGVGSTAPGGMKKANAWGLCDMAGNVWEWCEDWHGKYDGGAQTDPKGAPAGGLGVLRGGAWGSDPGGLRSAYRRARGPGSRSGDNGFRVVLAPGPR